MPKTRGATEDLGPRGRNLAQPSQQQHPAPQTGERIIRAVLEGFAEPIGREHRERRGIGTPRPRRIGREQPGLHRPHAGDRQPLGAPHDEASLGLAIRPTQARAGIE
jgi:hypothetical protein